MSFTRFLPPVWRKKIKNSHDMYSMHDAIIGAIDYTLSQVKDDTIMSKQESLLNEAEGPFLDYWGSWFGLNRKDGWSDDTYRAAIKSHVTHPRSTIEGIRQAIVNYFDLNMSDVYIYEPFRDIFRWNRGKWNSSYKFHSTYYDTAVIDIQVGKNVPSSIQDLLNWFRMAGVLWVVSYNGSAHDANAPIFDFTSEDNLLFINNLQFLYGYDIYDSFSLTPGIYSEPSAGISEFIWNKSAWNSGDSWLGQESKVTPYVELSQSSLDYTPSTLYNSDTQLFFGSTLEDTDYTALLANDNKYVPFSSSYKDENSNKLLGSANLKYFSAPLTAKEDFGNYKMYHVTSGVTISSSNVGNLPKGEYYIGCYAKLSSTASVKIKYSKNKEPVLLSSSYNGKYAWNSIKITVDDNFQIPDEGIQFIVSGPFKDGENYIGLFYLGSNEQYTDNDLSGNYVYSTFDLVGFYNRYIGELSGSDYGTEINSLYSNKLVSYAFRQINTSTDASGYFNVQLYNWNLKLWVTIGTLEDTFYSYSMNDISPYVNTNGYVYSRLDLTNASNRILNLNWVGLEVSKRTERYGVKLYSDNSNYGSYIDITTAGYLKLLYGYSLYDKEEILPGMHISDIPEYSVLNWNNNSWNDGSSWEGNYNAGLPFIESSLSSVDYTPKDYLGNYKLFMGTPTSQEELAKLGNKKGTISYSDGKESESNLLYASFSSLEGANEYPGVLVSNSNKDTLEVKVRPANKLTKGTYNIGLYACLPTESSVRVKYADDREPVPVSSNYQGEYQWNYTQVPYTESDTTTEVIYYISLPKGTTGYIQYVSLNSETNKVLSGGNTSYVYQTYDLVSYFVDKYKTLPSSSYDQLFSSLYNSSMLGINYTGLSGKYYFEVYNFNANHWDVISNLSGTSFSWRLTNYHDYLSKYGVLYTRLHAKDLSSITLSWLSLALANETEGYGTNLYSDNKEYGADIITELAKYLLSYYGINNYTRNEVHQGFFGQLPSFSWNESSWNSSASYSGKYPYGKQYLSMTESNTDFNPEGCQGLLPVGSPVNISNLGMSSVKLLNTYRDNQSNCLSEILPTSVTSEETVKVPIKTPLTSGTYYFGLYSNLPDNSTVKVQYSDSMEPQEVHPLASNGYKWQTFAIPVDTTNKVSDTFNITYKLPSGSQGYAGYYYLGSTNQRYTNNLEINKSVYSYGTINVVQSYLDQGNVLKSSNYTKEISEITSSSYILVTNTSSNSSFQVYNQVTKSWDTLTELSKGTESIKLDHIETYLNLDGVLYYRIIVSSDTDIKDIVLVINTLGKSAGTKLYSNNYEYGAYVVTE